MKTYRQFMEQVDPPLPRIPGKHVPRALLRKPVRPKYNTPIADPPSQIKYNMPTIIDKVPTPMNRQIKNFWKGGAQA